MVHCNSDIVHTTNMQNLELRHNSKWRNIERHQLYIIYFCFFSCSTESMPIKTGEKSAASITISKQERHKDASFLSQQQWLEGVIEAKVTSTIHDDSHTRDDKTTVQSDKTIRFDRLHVHVNHSIELPLSALQSTPDAFL